MKISDLGEKRIISDIIKPLINPESHHKLAGDDCAIVELNSSKNFNISTDRVPSDLISFDIGLINYFELGEYLAILNISDVYAGGGKPKGLLLNFAFPHNFNIKDLKDIFNGCKNIADKHQVTIYGGDLSDSKEMNLTATSFGEIEEDYAIYREGSKEGDLIFATDYIGMTPTAFKYFLEAKGKGMKLSEEEEKVLVNQFKNLEINTSLYKFLKENKIKVQGMDNTDGIAQSLLEQSEINQMNYHIHADKLKIHQVSYKVAKFLNISVIDLVLSGGANFTLVGTISEVTYKKYEKELSNYCMYPIGKCCKGNSGISLLNNNVVCQQNIRQFL